MFTRVSRTYGSTFIALLFLSYFTQGLRCFPWLAITYHFKDYLKVKRKAAKSPPSLLFLAGCFQVHIKSRNEANLCLLTKLPHNVSTWKESCLQQTTSQSWFSFEFFLQNGAAVGDLESITEFDRETLIMFHGLPCCHSSNQLSDIPVCSSIKFLGLLINEMDFFSNEFLCFEHVRFLCGFRV